jgi:hypothetical protein
MRIAALALASAAALALAGCAPTSHVTRTPTPSATAVFASDAAALAAAEKTYKGYVAMSDQILSDGGHDPARLRKWATGKALSAAVKGFDEAASKHWHAIGRTVVRDVLLEQRSRSRASAVTIYACDDVSGVDIVDAAGASVVSSSRPDLSPVEVVFALQGSHLLVSQVEGWDGGGICSQN